MRTRSSKHQPVRPGDPYGACFRMETVRDSVAKRANASPWPVCRVQDDHIATSGLQLQRGLQTGQPRANDNKALGGTWRRAGPRPSGSKRTGTNRGQGQKAPPVDRGRHLAEPVGAERPLSFPANGSVDA